MNYKNPQEIIVHLELAIVKLSDGTYRKGQKNLDTVLTGLRSIIASLKLPIALLCALILPTMADTLVLSTGTQNPGQKLITMAYQKPVLLDNVFAQLSVGAINRNFLAPETYVGLVSVDLGFRIEDQFYGQFTQGVALTTSTSKGLGTLYQLPTTVSGGLCNGTGCIGMFWKHFSNGTISKTNTGLNFIGIEMSLKL